MPEPLGCPVTWRTLEFRADELDYQLRHFPHPDDLQTRYDAWLLRRAAHLLRDQAQIAHDRSLLT